MEVQPALPQQENFTGSSTFPVDRRIETQASPLPFPSVPSVKSVVHPSSLFGLSSWGVTRENRLRLSGTVGPALTRVDTLVGSARDCLEIEAILAGVGFLACDDVRRHRVVVGRSTSRFGGQD
jgi:hypothetical protein